ncbi:MAG: hypothetical protein LR015_14905 [Verrucomicrobia bacterium]|nr:hypothetical protein [Verrucomicrobiota bacterium]
MLKFLSIPAAILLIASPILVLLDPTNIGNWSLAGAMLLTGAWLLYLGMKSGSDSSHQDHSPPN